MSSAKAKASSAKLDVDDVARQAREATGGARANVAGILRPDGVLRVVGSSIGPLELAWRRARELARDGERPLALEVDSTGRVRVHVDPEGREPAVDVDLGEGRSA